MRLGTIQAGVATQAVRVENESAVLLPFRDVGEALARTRLLSALARMDGEALALEQLTFAPLVIAPQKIICVGLNYRSHIAEMGRTPPPHPTLFAKFATSLVGAGDDVVLPSASTSVDWEAQLAVVIGAQGRQLGADTARDVIAGYTVANDVSVRDWQWRTPQWLQGKTFDRTTPLGPLLVTGDEIDDARDLPIRCVVDGVERQASRTSDLLFAPAELVSYVSEAVSLMPGDVILTGTPGGVGSGAEPPVYLQPERSLVTSIEGIGACHNTCVEERVADLAIAGAMNGGAS